MPIPEIEEFARILTKEVRDAAIRSTDRSLRVDAPDPVAKRWKAAAGDRNLESIASMVAPDIVDDTIFHLLRAIDQELLQLSFTASNGKTVNLSKEGLGELGGWYMGSPGWRAKYSTERFVDDLADLGSGNGNPS
jgi:hypothetical protein